MRTVDANVSRTDAYDYNSISLQILDRKGQYHFYRSAMDALPRLTAAPVGRGPYRCTKGSSLEKRLDRFEKLGIVQNTEEDVSMKLNPIQTAREPISGQWWWQVTPAE
jgi:hypothetical protein